KQYFQKNYEHSTRTKKLVEKIEDIKFTSVDSELEANILEHNLIKDVQPKYNVIMKDGKSYVYIKITKEDFPRIQIVREIKKDKAKYIGPKTAAHKIKDTFKILKKIFPFRHCSLDIQLLEEPNKVKVTKKTIKYPCLDYYIKRCAAPCIGKCTKEEYQAIIKNVENFLHGKADGVLSDLTNQMNELAKNKQYEKAAKMRDKIGKVRDILEKQKVQDDGQTDKDVINYLITHEKAYFNLFQIRGGKLIGQENFILNASGAEDKTEETEVLQAFIEQYYNIATDIPKEVLIPHKIGEEPVEPKLKFIIPQKGNKNKLLNMSLNNARIYADRNKASWQEDSKLNEDAAKELQKVLKLKEPLKRIECYDISHLGGTDTVGSMVVFEKGVPKNKLYRKFKIKTVENKPDDYKSMEEVLIRRFQKIVMRFRHKDLKVIKARKKDDKFIKDHTNKTISRKGKQFYVIEKKKKTIGFIAIKEHNPKTIEFTNLYVLEKERGTKIGFKIIREALRKTTAKRVYAICRRELLDYYTLFGFEEIKKLPEEMHYRVAEIKKHRKLKNLVLIAYDKLKHKEDESFSKIPDLIVIDGGKGQLGIAEKIMQNLHINIPHISLAKEMEEIFIPGKKDSIILDRTSNALKLLQRARDEAHRFAISYNKNLRSKRLRPKRK
ncbi:excinuclease ABC subunit C, partial [Candidatus Peregrinibacteria bacterium]|nr:excinuclease ABC subunit C [Candidatus Peregrinibacteria bacterium]